jgi:hypothetical protein
MLCGLHLFSCLGFDYKSVPDCYERDYVGWGAGGTGGVRNNRHIVALADLFR